MQRDPDTLVGGDETRGARRVDAIIDLDTGEVVFEAGRTFLFGPGLVVEETAEGPVFTELASGDTWSWAGDAPLNADVARSSGRVYQRDDDAHTYTWIDLRTGDELGPTLGTEGFPFSVADSSDGSRVLIRYQTAIGALRVAVFDGATGELLADGLEGIFGAVITPDGSHVVSSSYDGLWVSDSAVLEPDVVLPKPLAAVARPDISADGTTLAAAGFDGTVTLYDLPHRLQLGRPIQGTNVTYKSGSLSSDGTLLVVNTPYGVVRWNLDAESLVAAACRIAGRELTADEWATHLGDLGPQRATCEGQLP